VSDLEGLRERAFAGDAEAESAIAWRFMRGEGVEKDPDQAVWWMGRAAAQGDVEAQYRVGVWLALLGRSDEADAWVSRAADAGHGAAAGWLRVDSP
jgi:TPR repeat protein